MTIVTDLKMRVWVEDAWDVATFQAAPDWSMARVKAEAIEVATQSGRDPKDYVIKVRGAAVLDEARTLRDLALPDLAPLVVMSARRRPVR